MTTPINNPLAELKSELILTEQPDISVCGFIYKHPSIHVTQRRALYTYCKNAISAGEVEVVYKRKLYGTEKAPLGRFYADASILSSPYQPCAVKAAFFARTETDVDAIASHPQVLLGLAKTYLEDASTPSLEHYLCKRQEVLDSIELVEGVCSRYNKKNGLEHGQALCIRDIKKMLFNILCYGGTIRTWERKFDIISTEYKLPVFVRKFQSELKQLVKELLCCPTIAPTSALIKRHLLKTNAKDGAPEHKIVSHVVQTFETELVLIMLEAFKNADVPVRGFIYDGLHIGCKDPVKIKQIFEMGYRKQQEIFGFILPFTIKDWAEPIEKCLPEEEIDDAIYFEYFNAVNSETLSKVIYSYLNGDYIVENKCLKVYKKGVWQKADLNGLYGFLKTPVYNDIKQKLLTYKIEKKIAMMVLTHTGNSNPFTAALNDAIKHSETEKYSINWDERPNLLNFKNGTYNFHTHVLQPHNRDEFITKQVPCDFDAQQLKAHDSISDIFKDWFEIKGRCEGKEMTDYVNYLLYLLSVCLDGSNDYQKALILYGRLSRNGKSSFCDLMNNALGSYCGSIPYAHFTQNDRDANAPKPYILNLQGIRYAFVNEADNSHHEVRGINNKPFKEMTGKDLLTARDLYGNKNDLVSFKPQFLIIMPCNDVVRFMKEENATTNRLTVFNFDCYFGDEGMVGWSKDKPYCKALNGNYKREVIENKIVSSQFIHHLIFLNKSWGSDWTNIEPPVRQVADENSYKGEVDEIKSWADKYLVYDKSPFNANAEKDKFICVRHPNIHGRPRVMTLDSLYFNYKKDMNEPATYRSFITRITALFNDLYDKKMTKLFGKQKQFIYDIRYTAYDDEVVEPSADHC